MYTTARPLSIANKYITHRLQINVCQKIEKIQAMQFCILTHIHVFQHGLKKIYRRELFAIARVYCNLIVWFQHILFKNNFNPL